MPLPPPPSAAATPATPATPEFKLSMFLPMIVLIGWSKLDIDTSEGTNALLYIRVLFYAIACSCIVCGLYIKSQVQASNNGINYYNSGTFDKAANSFDLAAEIARNFEKNLGHVHGEHL